MEVRPRRRRTLAVLIGLVLIAALGFVRPMPGETHHGPESCPRPSPAARRIDQLVDRRPPHCTESPRPHTP